MDEAVDAGDDLREGAEGGDGHDLDGDDVADLIHGLDLLPRIVLGLLIDEGNTVVLTVNVLDGDFNGIADVDNFRGMLDAQPGQIGEADAAVHSAEVDKSAEIGEALDAAGVDLAHFDLFPELLGELVTGFPLNDADGAYGAAALTVGLEDLELDFLVKQGVEVAVSRNTGLARRYKDLDAVGEDEQAALDDFGDDAGENFAGIAGIHDFFKAGSSIQTGLGQHCGAFDVVDADNHQFDLVADFNDVFRLLGRIVGQLFQRYIASMLGTGINCDLSRLDVRNNGRYLLPIMYTFRILIQQFSKVHFFGSVVFQFAHGILNLLNYTSRG